MPLRYHITLTYYSLSKIFHSVADLNTSVTDLDFPPSNLTVASRITSTICRESNHKTFADVCSEASSEAQVG